MTNDDVVTLRCECGADFECKQKLFAEYEECKDTYPSVARIIKRKITLCDKCSREKVKRALNALPDVLKALAT